MGGLETICKRLDLKENNWQKFNFFLESMLYCSKAIKGQEILLIEMTRGLFGRFCDIFVLNYVLLIFLYLFKETRYLQCIFIPSFGLKASIFASQSA